MTDFVVDFQGFCDDGKNFIIKELCIQCLKDLKCVDIKQQYLFLPPFDYRHLSDNKKKQVKWLKDFLHGFSWNCGIQDYEDLYTILNRLAVEGKYIYVKGLQKKKHLEKLINNETIKVIDLDELQCPSLKVLKQEHTYNINCPYRHNLKNCAVNNVYYLTHWIANNL